MPMNSKSSQSYDRCALSLYKFLNPRAFIIFSFIHDSRMIVLNSADRSDVSCGTPCCIHYSAASSALIRKASIVRRQVLITVF